MKVISTCISSWFEFCILFHGFIHIGEIRYKKLKENDENQRRDKVAQAQDVLTKLKIGPRNLESAYIMSEIADARKKQCVINDEAKRAKRTADEKLSKDHIDQADQWAEEQRKKIIVNKQRKDAYKKELLTFVREKESAMQQQERKNVDQERQERENIDRDLRMQVEKERALLQRKKDASRLNALEAMRMAEQRRISKLFFF